MSPSTIEAVILVVDDRSSLCELMQVILCRVGYHVLTATNGADALSLARKTPKIDLLLSELGMPGMCGNDLAARFAALHPSSAIVFVSSSAPPIPLAEPYHFLAKPFTVAGLRATVRRALQTRPAIHETSRAA